MQKIFTYFLSISLLFTITLLISCKQDDPEPIQKQDGVVGNNSNLDVKQDNKITKKWIVIISSNLKLSAEASDFEWFEFSPYGFYVIMMRDGTVIDGKYTYDENNNSIDLEGYGAIKITKVTSTEFSFTITPTGESPINLLSFPEALEDASDKTLQMARSWKLISQKLNGTETSLLNDCDSAYVMITKYGTHILAIRNSSTSDLFIPQVWKWNNESKSSICVGDTEPDCTNAISITLTAENKMIAEYTDEEGTYKEEYIELILE